MTNKKQIRIPSGSILGVNYNGAHDSAIAVVSPEGVPLFASCLERVTREKQDGRSPVKLLEDIPWDNIAQIAISTDREPWEPENFDSRLHPVRLPAPREHALVHGPQFLEFVDSLPKPKQFVCHQLSHAASAFWISGFEESLVLTYDGGIQNSPWFGGLYKAGRDKGIEPLDRFPSANYAKVTSLYSIVTALLGFTPNKHEGKITGLAAYGEPTERCRAILNKLFTTNDYYLMEELVEWFFMYSDTIPPILLANDDRRKKLLERFDGIERNEMAATVQAIAEEHIAQILANAKKQGWESGSICLAGGLFANVKINQSVKQSGFENIFIAPPMTDDGTALGAALAVAGKNKNFDPPKLEHMFWGHKFSSGQIESSLTDSSLSYKKIDNPAGFVAERLAEGKVIGLFQGAIEFGPRALGNRSIICQATDKNINQTLNARLARTEFMPFAPITRVEDAHECYLNMEGAQFAAEFMTITFECSEFMKRQSPAVVHVDGTARPQIVRREIHPFVHDVLTRYKSITGIPSLINTSFNVHEEPIVRSPEDAIKGFMDAGLDYLYMEGGYIVDFEVNKDRIFAVLASKARRKPRKDERMAAVMNELFRRNNKMFGELKEKEAVIQDQAEEIESIGERLHELDDVFYRFKLHLLVKILMKIRWLVRFIKWVMLMGASRILKKKQAPVQTVASKPGVTRTDLKLSIVTPSFNHGKYIETTIKSVFANKYPNVEYMVMDGGSDDDTEKVVAKYKDRIAKFVSEKDNGQADAINKGFKHATGDIYAYINADDYYFPDAFEKVMKVFDDNPDIDVVYGHCVFVHATGEFMSYFYEIEPFDEYRLRTCSDFIMQPATFFRKEAFEKAGGFDDMLKYCFDWDAWCKMAESGLKFYLLEEPLAVNRSHAETKTNSGGRARLWEIYRTVLRHKKGLIPHAIFNYTLNEVNKMDKSWYKPSLVALMRLACYNQVVYTVRNLGSRALYGLHPSSNIVGQTAVFHLPWYGAPAKNISFTVCVPWVQISNSKMLIKLNDKVVGERCFCSNGRKMKIALDCDGQGPNHFKLELEFSKVFLLRYGGIVSDIKIT